MEQYVICDRQIAAFGEYLRQKERAAGTVEKYLRDVHAHMLWLQGRSAGHETTAAWKEHLIQENYAPVTINSMLSSLHSFFRFLGWDSCRTDYLRIQRRLFRPAEKELTRGEYLHLLETAHNQERNDLALLMETICATGIRVSEIAYVTVEAARVGRTEVALKGKIRTILIPQKLCRKLLDFAKKQKITAGAVFRGKDGNPISRKTVWSAMKSLCKHAGVTWSKVFPHNLRHLFARTFYRACQDVAQLADLLGHSSIETTRIYLLSTGEEHARKLDRLGLLRE